MPTTTTAETITQGGYSDHITVDQHFVVTIPDSLPLDVAAPLLCAGVTTYSPLKEWKVGPGSKVAVIGLGGLGHMAVKLAAAMGAAPLLGVAGLTLVGHGRSSAKAVRNALAMAHRFAESRFVPTLAQEIAEAAKGPR